MARTKNTVRGNPFELHQATLDDHLRNIAATPDKEAVETKKMGSSIPTEVKEPHIENVKTVACLDVNSPEGEPETMSMPDGHLNTPVFPEIMGLNIPQDFQKGTPSRDISEAIMLHSVYHPLAFSPTYFSLNIPSLANSPGTNVPQETVTLLVPLNPVEVDHKVNKAIAKKDLTLSEKVDM